VQLFNVRIWAPPGLQAICIWQTWHDCIRAEPQPRVLAESEVAKQPGLGDRVAIDLTCRLSHLQIQIAAIGILSRALGVLHKQSGDSLRQTQLLAL